MSLLQITGLVYVLCQSKMSISKDEDVENAFIYHILHPNGKGKSLVCIMQGGNRAQCLETMTDRDAAVFLRVEQAILQLAQLMLTNRDFYVSSYYEPIIEEITNTYRRADDLLTDEQLSTALPLFESWNPTNAQLPLYNFVSAFFDDDD